MYPLANWLLAAFCFTGGFRGLIEDNPERQLLHTRPDVVKTGSTINVKRMDDLGGYKPSSEHFTIQCAIEWKRSDKESANKNHHPITRLQFPQLTVRDGERMRISDRSSDSYIVAELPDPSLPRGFLPVTRELQEGSTVEVTVLGINDREALVDVMIEFQGTRQTIAEESSGLRIDYVKGRAIERIEIGKLTTFKLNDFDIEATVESAIPNEASARK